MKVGVLDNDPAEAEIAGARNGHKDLISFACQNERTKMFVQVYYEKNSNQRQQDARRLQKLERQ